MWTISIVDRARPDRSTDALVKATCLSDLPAARAHWDAWRQSNSLDKIDWRDQRYLARLAKRLPTIAPGHPINPRIVGLSRALWTRSQVAVKFASRLIDALSEAGAPILLLGSAAVEAWMTSQGSKDVAAATDLQILTTRRWFGKAQALAYRLGFERKQTRTDFLGAHAAIALRGGGSVFLALRSQPVGLPYLGDRQLSDFWSRAEQANFRGRPMLIPSHEDMIALTARQSLDRTKDGRPATAWPIELVDLLSVSSPRPDRLIAAAGQIGCLNSLVGAICYLSEQLDIGEAKKIFESTDIGHIAGRRWRFYHEYLRTMQSQFCVVKHGTGVLPWSRGTWGCSEQ
jgi:hypothetical protein